VSTSPRDDAVGSGTEIQVFETAPLDPARPNERSRWSRFWSAIFPHLAKKWELGNRYLSAKVEHEEQDGKARAAEAAEIAAKTDSQRQVGARAFCDLVDDMPGLTKQEAATLKLAKLLASNPDVADQLERVKYLQERLRLGRGAEIEIVIKEVSSHGGHVADLDEFEGADGKKYVLKPIPVVPAVPPVPPPPRHPPPLGVIIDSGAAAAMDRTIRSLNLSVRTTECLHSVGIERMSQLLEWKSSDLLTIRAFGQTSLSEVTRAIIELNLQRFWRG